MMMSHFLQVRNGQFESDMGKVALAKWFDEIATRHRTLVIHIHGGLVASERIRATAEDRLNAAYASGDSASLFVVWGTDLLTQLRTNFKDIVSSVLFKRLVMRLTRFLAAKIFRSIDAEARGAYDPPNLFMDNFEDPEVVANFLDTWREGREQTSKSYDSLGAEELDWLKQEFDDPVLRHQINGLVASHQIRGEGSGGDAKVEALPKVVANVDPKVLEELFGAEEDTRAFEWLAIIAFARSLVSNVLRRFREGRDYGLYPTIVEEVARKLYLDTLGGGVWEAMKGDTADAFNSNSERPAGLALLERLDQWQSQADDRRIVLVGHSAGSVYICRLLQSASVERRFEVIFQTAACTFDLFSEVVTQHSEKIKHFRNFALSDEQERGYFEIPVFYMGSLLYIISGLLEDEVDKPIVGMERYWDDSHKEVYDAIDSVRTSKAWIAKNDPNAHVWSPAVGVSGRECDFERHGDAPSNDRMLSSIQHILTSGF